MSPGPGGWRSGLGLGALCLLLVTLYFVNLPGRDDLILGGLSLVAILVGGSSGLPRLDGRRAWPYLAYLAAVSVSALLAWSAEAGAEWARQALFLGIVFATARAGRSPRGRRAIFGLLVGCTLLLELQALGYGLQVEWFADRPDFYPWTIQWSGYPELGMLAALGATTTFALYASAPGWGLRAASALLSAFFAVAALRLYSRSAWVTIALVAAWLAVAAVVRWRRWASGALLLVFGVIALITIRSAPLIARFLFSFSEGLGHANVVARLNGWKAAAVIVSHHPLFGVGPGMYTRGYMEYFTDRSVVYLSQGYNFLFHFAAEVGLVGVAAYLAIWGRALIVSFRRSSPTLDGSVTFAVHALLAAFFLRSLSECFTASYLAASFRFLLLTGVMFGLAETAERQD